MTKPKVTFPYLPDFGARRILAATRPVEAVTDGALFLGARSTAMSAPAQPASVLTAAVVSAVEAVWPRLLEASGTIAPWQKAVIGAQVPAIGP